MKKTGVKKRAFAAVLTTALALSLSVGSITGYGADDDDDDDYDWDSGADDSGYTVPFKLSDEGGDKVGPGAVLDTDSEQKSGPSLSQSALSEQYHEDYKIYEESIEGIFFFYSTVANGGITHEPVKLDLPANLTWTAEKDGQPWTYVPGQPVSERGTYVFRFSGIEDTSLPLSEQKEYRAVFRFRIQEKPPKEAEDEAESAASALGTVGGYASSLIGGGLIPGGSGGQQTETSEAAETGAAETEAAAEAGDSDETEAVPASAEAGEETVAGTEEAVPVGADVAGTDGASQEGAEKAAGDGTIAAGGGGAVNKTAFTQTFDTSAQRYQVAFENGVAVTSNVPGGYAGIGPVEIVLSDGSMEEVSVYQDDVPVTEPAAEGDTIRFEENGYYRLETGGASWSFAIMTATGRMDCYPAPVGMRFKEVTLDGEPLETFARDYVLMEADGQYSLVMEGDAGENFMVGIKKDTEPPQIEVAVGKGSASIQYLSEDIADILLEKSGKPVEGFKGYSVTAPGNYRLTVTDEAGNATSVSFTLKYQVNTYGIAAVILVILVIIGIVVFVIHTKKTVKIR